MLPKCHATEYYIMWYIWLPLYQKKLTKAATISVGGERESKRMTLIMTALLHVIWFSDN